MRLKAFLAATAALALAGPAAAERMWLLPTTTIVSPGNDWVSIDAGGSSDPFLPDNFPLRPDQITVWAPDGTPAQIDSPTNLHNRSVFDVKLDRPGTWKIGYAQSGVMGSFKLNGEDWRVGGRPGGMRPGGPGQGAAGQGRPGGAPGFAGAPAAGGQPGSGMAPGGPGRPMRPSVPTVADIPAGATDVHLAENLTRIETFVTAGPSTTTVFTPTGKGLEMQPVTHPNELVSNEPARFRFLIDGKPAANITVTVIPGGKRYREQEGAVDVTTGADGVATVKWPFAGMFWLSAMATDKHPSEPKATERRMTYAATLEVLAP